MFFQFCGFSTVDGLDVFPPLTQAFCTMTISSAFASHDHTIQGDYFILKGISVRWLSCNTVTSPSF